MRQFTTRWYNQSTNQSHSVVGVLREMPPLWRPPIDACPLIISNHLATNTCTTLYGARASWRVEKYANWSPAWLTNTYHKKVLLYMSPFCHNLNVKLWAQMEARVNAWGESYTNWIVDPTIILNIYRHCWPILHRSAAINNSTDRYSQPVSSSSMHTVSLA